MSLAPMRPCAGAGGRRCRHVSRETRCPWCTQRHEGARQQRLEEQRPDVHALYASALWRRLRGLQLHQHPLCGQRAAEAYADGWRGECHDTRRIRAATVLDHIRAHKGDLGLFWDPRNRQSLCADCNRIKAIRYEGGFGRAPVSSL